MDATHFASNASEAHKLRSILGYIPKLRNATSGAYSYLGEAAPGTETSAASWRIVRITDASGDIDHADGDDNFDNVWDNYATLTYT